MDIIEHITERSTRRVLWLRVAIDVMAEILPCRAPRDKSGFAF
ncbi:hypothetical protein [Brachybacterium sp. YJGR34]|nr:hypothetical protein [Brachybacterium sp. YJGR34]